MVFFVIYESSKINFYYIVLSLRLAINQGVEGYREPMFNAQEVA